MKHTKRSCKIVQVYDYSLSYRHIILKITVYSTSAVDVSLSLFAQLRPQHVNAKSSMPHRVCVRLYHENIYLFIDALSKPINGPPCSDLQVFTTALVYDESNEQYMLSNCNYCCSNFKLNVESKIINETVQLKWFHWNTNRGHDEKME